MSHHQANRIRSKLAPFIRFMLVIACLGLLASCGGNDNAETLTNSISSTPTGISADELRLTDGLPGAVDVNEYEIYQGQKVAAKQILIFPEVSDDDVKKFALSQKWKVLARSGLAFQVYIGDQSIDTAIKIVESEKIGRAQSNDILSLNANNNIDDTFSESTSENSWALKSIQAAEAWAHIPNNANEGPLVGIIDGGFRFDHEDLKFSRIAEGSFDTSNDFVKFTHCNNGDAQDEPINGTPCKNATHGMNVAGIISAKGNNSKGIAGVAWLNPTYPIAYRFDSESSIIDGIHWMLKREPKVINLSLGATYSGNQDKNEIKKRIEKKANELVRVLKNAYPIFPNILIVQAAGNNGRVAFSDGSTIFSDYSSVFASIAGEAYAIDADLVSYVDSIRKNLIIVGSFDESRNLSAFSSQPLNSITPFILAPGGTGGTSYKTFTGNIVAPAFSGTNKYVAMGGTSQAAPHVTGVAALVMQANPMLTASEVRNIILENSDTIGKYKSLNAEKAVSAAIALISSPSASIKVITPKPTASGVVIFEPVIEATPNGGITSFAWSFGDGATTTNTGGQVQHNYIEAGSYTVTLSITDAKGRTAVSSKVITVAAIAALPTITRMTPSITTAGQTQLFSIIGSNLPTTSNLDITFSGCPNIVYGSKTENLHQFTCNPQAAGTITAVIRTQPGAALLGSFPVAVSASQVVCQLPQVPQNGVCTTPFVRREIPDTGITSSQCYATGSDALVSCTSTAAIALNSQQDGMVGRDVLNNNNTDGKAGLSYSVVANPAGGSFDKTECIKDNITGLMWEGKPVDGGYRDARNTYTNYGDNRSGDASAYVTAVNIVGLCGANDWRLPTTDELQSILDYSWVLPAIDKNWFLNHYGGQDFWSSSSYIEDPEYAWYVGFYNGNISPLPRNGYVNGGSNQFIRVRLVRN